MSHPPSAPNPPVPDAAGPFSFEACYQQHWRRVYRTCLRYAGGNASWAEDVTHDVFVKLLENISGLERHEDLGGWLYRVATNLSLSRLRRSRSILSRFLPAYGQEQDDSHPAPDSTFEQHESAAAAMATLNALPPRERVVISMKVLDGKSQKEIADTLSLSEGYVSKLLARAWQRVRAAGWDPDGAESEESRGQAEVGAEVGSEVGVEVRANEKA